MTERKPRKALFNPEIKRRGIYVLPNLFTTAALFAGFFAIVQAMQGDFERAAMAIFIAMVLDGLDGRVARTGHLRMGATRFGKAWLDCGIYILRWCSLAFGAIQYHARSDG